MVLLIRKVGNNKKKGPKEGELLKMKVLTRFNKHNNRNEFSQVIFNKQRSHKQSSKTQLEPDLMETQPDISILPCPQTVSNKLSKCKQNKQPSKEQMLPIISLNEETIHSSPNHSVDENDEKTINLPIEEDRRVEEQNGGQPLNIYSLWLLLWSQQRNLANWFESSIAMTIERLIVINEIDVFLFQEMNKTDNFVHQISMSFGKGQLWLE